MNKELKNNILKLLVTSIFFILLILINNNCYAKSYSIENMNIEATILVDGAVNIKQSITYKFEGDYNGIYITIPCNFSDTERDEANKQLNDDDELYNGTSIEVNRITDSSGIKYQNAYSGYVTNGSKGKYTIDEDEEKYTIKVYSPSQYETKTFIIDYNINDLCVKHADVGELYYNFIGGEWDVNIKNLNIDILLPNNESIDDLYAFGHGPYNGVVTIVSKNQVNFKVENVKKGQYVASRVIFNNNNIKNSTKVVSTNALSEIMNEENNIFENKESKRRFTNKLLIIAVIFFVYWIVLIFVYEKDKKYVAAYTGEQELFEKYNPLIAGCIQGSREILARDIIAVILNLIDKKKIEMEILPNSDNKEPYKYILKKTDEENMDEIELFIYNWLFEEKRSINLTSRLKEMPKEKEANKKFKELNKLAKNKLNKIGANMSKVPMTLRVFNVLLFLISIVLVFVHIQYNKLNIYDSNTLYLNIIILLQFFIILIPISVGILSIPINILIATRHRVNKLIRKFTGQKVVTTTVSIVLLFFVIILITAIFAKESKFLIVDELLIGISLIIMLTDNLMLKNDAVMIEDFSRLNMIKDKLEDDKLFEERDIEQIVLWEKYLAYGVAFGISGKISKKIKEMHIDDDLEHLLESSSLLNCMNSGYYDFYLYASLDRRFVKSYNKMTGKLLSGTGSGGFSGGSGRRIFTVEVDSLEVEAEAGGRRSILIKEYFMSMRLIYGRAGTGKSEFILKEIKEELQSNLTQKIYIIVPEQFSYATEKRLLETLESNSTVNVEVLSFKRLAHRISLEVGGSGETNLTKTGKAMLIRYIINKNKSNLNFLGKTNEIDLILRTITELKKHNIDEGKLQKQLDSIDDEYLKLKLEDISKIYSVYEEIIKNNYIDEEDILTILSKQIKYSKMFDNCLIYIDEFSGFTEQEYIIIEEILKKAKEVSITICTNNLEEAKNPENDIFYSNKQVVKKLIDHAKQANVNIDKPIGLNNQYRFKNIELQLLEKNIYATKNETYDKCVEHIHLSLANNPYAEIEKIAQTIIQLVREKDIRFRDISLITKNIEDYKGAVLAIFPKYNIPVFIDTKKELSDNILVKYVLSIFDIYAKNWSSDAVWTYIKTGFTNIPKKDIYKLENYCKKWGIRGNKWYKEDWKYDSLNKDIENLNNLRKMIVNPLIDFSKKLKDKKTAEEITKQLYEFLEENEIKNKLEEKLKKLENKEEIKYANEYVSGWNILMDILDEINLIFGEQKIKFEEYREILKSGLEVSSFGEIPQVIDEVTIGDIERSRNHKIDILFILGLNDGAFPSINNEEGFLNDKDREYLKENGLELAKGTIENLYEEQFNIYKAFTTAQSDIYLSYVSSDKEGKAKRPSTLITKVKKIFPRLKEESDVLKEETNISTPQATFKDLLSNIRKLKNGEEVDYIWKNVYNWYINNEQWNKKILKAIKGFEDKNNPEKISEKNIKRLYGNVLKTSISRLEQYKRCPFSFHLKYGLKLKEKEELKIKPIDTGTFMHDIIDTFFETTNNIKNITQEEIEKVVEDIINQKLNLSKNYIFTSSPKFTVLTNRLKKVVIQSIKYIVFQIQNSDFEIIGNEIEFKRRIDNVEIVGKIDRLDAAKTENAQYIRIIDYKSSEKNIDLNEFMSGTQIQLITYLDSVVSEQENKLPAGMLYFKMIDPIVKSDKNKTEEEIKEELKKRFKMNGMVLADINIIKKMDKTLEKGASNAIPVYLDKDGNISNSRSNVVTKEQFTQLQKTAEKIIKQITKEILEGNIDIKPTYNKKTKIDSCKYCEYKTICRFNPKVNHYSFIENKSKDEVLGELKGVESKNIDITRK